MSYAASVIAFTLLDLAAIAALAAVCVVAFRLGRRPAPAATVAQLPNDRLEPAQRAA